MTRHAAWRYAYVLLACLVFTVLGPTSIAQAALGLSAATGDASLGATSQGGRAAACRWRRRPGPLPPVRPQVRQGPRPLRPVRPKVLRPVRPVVRQGRPVPPVRPVVRQRPGQHFASQRAHDNRHQPGRRDPAPV